MEFPVTFKINKTKVTLFGMAESGVVIVKFGKERKTNMPLPEYNEKVQALAPVTRDMNPGEWYSWCGALPSCGWESDCGEAIGSICAGCGESAGVCPCPKP